MLFIFSCFLVVWAAQDIKAECPPIIGRKEWDAAKPLHRNYLDVPVDLVVIQHTVTQSCSNDKSCAEVVRDLQKTHIEQSFLWDIAPSFLVGGTGKLYEGRGWHYVSIHTPGFNNQSIGIAFIGNFNNQDPSPKSLNAVQDLIKCGVDENRLTPDHKVVVHSQLVSTESPGKKLANKIMSWPDWVKDVSEIIKRADKQEETKTEEPGQEGRSGNDLILTKPKEIDALTHLRDVIGELIQNMAKLARETIETLERLAKGINEQAALFTKTVASQLKAFKDQISAAFSAVSNIPGARKCSQALQQKTNTLYDDAESKAKDCADKRINEVSEMIKNLGDISHNAIDYTKVATENTKNCTEVNYGIESSTKACLNAVTAQTQTAATTFEAQRQTSLNSINTLVKSLPDALQLCAQKHLQKAGAETPKIASEISKCSTSILPFGFGR